MEKIIVSCDSTADLSVEILKKYNISVSPLHVNLGGNDYKDGVDITPNDIFSFVKKNNTLPKTSACSVIEYMTLFEELLKNNDYIIHFTISSKCSSTYNNAVLAANEYNGRVKVIDSFHLSTGQGLLVLKACDLINEGKTLDEVIKIVEDLKNKIETSFVVDTVDYLYKGGRCSAVSRIASKVLAIHPAIIMKNGSLGVKKNYRGNLKKAIESYTKDLASEYSSYDDTRVFITHSCCSDEIVENTKKILEEKFHFKEILITTAGCVVTSHCGKGTLGVLFITK